MAKGITERHWVDSPKAFERRMEEVLALYPTQIEPFELCRTTTGIPVQGLRMGKGGKSVFLLGRVHGHEPAGTCGLVALVEGLAKGVVPGSRQVFGESQRVLGNFTLYIFPMVNPEAAERYSSQIKDSYVPPYLKYKSLVRDYYAIIHEPGYMLDKTRPPHYSVQELDAFKKTGKPMGTLFTEDGVELWMDWRYDKAPQTRALKRLLRASKPVLLVDVHQHEHATTIFTPTELREKDTRVYRSLGYLVYDALERVSLPFNPDRQVGPYLPGQDPHQCVAWAYNNFGTVQFLYEVDVGYRISDGISPESHFTNKTPTVSKEQIILSVWHGITALLSAEGKLL